MKIVRLEYDQKELYAGMDPFRHTDDMAKPGYFALVAARDTAEEDIPAGLLVGEITRARLLIHWLFVLPEERQKGAGEALLTEAVEIAGKEGCRLVSALINLQPDWRNLCPTADLYLQEQGFEMEKRPSETDKAIRVMTTSADYFAKEKRRWRELPYSAQLALLTGEGLLPKAT